MSQLVIIILQQIQMMNHVICEQYYDCDGVCLLDSDGDGVCDELEVLGCTDSTAFNFELSATDDDGSCISVVEGCTFENAFNYNEEAM